MPSALGDSRVRFTELQLLPMTKQWAELSTASCHTVAVDCVDLHYRLLLPRRLIALGYASP